MLRGPLLPLGLVFFASILPLFLMVQESTATPPPRPRCRPLLSLVGYVIRTSRPLQPFPVALQIGQALLRSSRETGLPLYLLVAVAQEESSFNPDAINRASEDYGLFQVHYPFWERFFKKREKSGLRAISRKDLMGVSVNARMASDILSYDLKISRGDVVEMLGRYSGRTGESQKRYVQNILRYSLEFERDQKGKSESCPGS